MVTICPKCNGEKTKRAKVCIKCLNKGRKHSKEVNLKKGRFGEENAFYGKKHSKESLLKMSESHSNRTEEWRIKQHDAHKGLHDGENNYMYGKTHSKEAREKISKVKKGKKYEELYDKDKCIKIKEGLRLSKIEYLKEQYKESGIWSPTIGRYEKPILDHLESCLNYPIIRQYAVNGYFLDGYCPALNLAVEIDEKGHFIEQKKIKDKKRQSYIENELGCKFLRIPIMV